MDSDNKKSVGYYCFGIALNLIGIIVCAVSGIPVSIEDTDGIAVLMVMLLILVYPLFFIFGTILIVNKYYYNRRHWKYIRITTGIIQISIATIAIFASPYIDNIVLSTGAIYELICGIIVLANQNKILPENVALPDEEEEDDEEDDAFSIYESVGSSTHNQIRATKTVQKQNSPSKDIIKPASYSALTITNGALGIAGEIEHFSMEDIDTISSIENTTKKGKLFEEYVAKILEYNMYTDVTIIGGSGDLGGDIEARRTNRKVIIQCKCYNGSVPYRAIQEVFSAARTRGGIPIVITNSHFSKQSIENAEIQGVTLFDRNELQKMIDNANEVIESGRSFVSRRVRERKLDDEERDIEERNIVRKAETRGMEKKKPEEDPNME